MKTFFVKKGRGAKPVVGASIVEKKPSVGEYINFNVPTDVKIELNRQGSLAGPFTPEMNTLIEGDNIYMGFATNYDGSTGGSYFDFGTAVPPLNGNNTVGVLLNALNTRLGSMGHVVLENGVFYLTKNGLVGEIDINTAYIGVNTWC
jgi:hypothetical protein